MSCLFLFVCTIALAIAFPTFPGPAVLAFVLMVIFVGTNLDVFTK